MSFKFQKLNLSSQATKVDHPLAKYNSRGDLYCLLCNILIKNANIWKVHLSTRSHKQNLLLFKSGNKPNPPDNSHQKRKSENPAPPRSLKKQKLSQSSSEKTEKPKCTSITEQESKKQGILKASSKVIPKLPEGFVPKSRAVKIVCNNSEDISKLREIESKNKITCWVF